MNYHNYMKKIGVFLVLSLAIIWLYTNSLIGVNSKAKFYLKTLNIEVLEKGYAPNFFVISGRRWAWDNYLLNKFGGAAKKSQHLKGNAIDIIVLDINEDNRIDEKDIDLIYNLLDKKIIRDKGGIGTYKKEKGLLNRQMIHFDCRGYKARWKR